MKRLERQLQVIKVVITTDNGYLFDATYNDDVLVRSSTTPFLDAARELSRRGHDDDTVIEMYRPGELKWSLRSTVGGARKLVVTTGRTGRPVFGRFRRNERETEG